MYLGVTGIGKSDISACHRLMNPKVIFVRFSHHNNSDRVYRARTKPKRRGLLVFESLTAERLSVIGMIKALKDDPSSSVLSYFTQAGKILVRTSESRDVRPIEIPFGCGLDQIRELCEGRKVTPSDSAVRDQFRAIHGCAPSHDHDRAQVGASSKYGNPWIPVQRNRNKTNNPKVPPASRQASRPAQEPGEPVGDRMPGDSCSWKRAYQRPVC